MLIIYWEFQDGKLKAKYDKSIKKEWLLNSAVQTKCNTYDERLGVMAILKFGNYAVV